MSANRWENFEKLVRVWKKPMINIRGEDSTDVSYDSTMLKCANELDAVIRAEQAASQGETSREAELEEALRWALDKVSRTGSIGGMVYCLYCNWDANLANGGAMVHTDDCPYAKYFALLSKTRPAIQESSRPGGG